MSKTFYSFLFDRSVATKFPEQSYYVEALSDHEMMTYVGIPSLNSFVQEINPNPIGQLRSVLIHGYRKQPVGTGEEFSLDTLYHHAMRSRWKNDLDYIQYKIDLDFAQEDKKHIVSFYKDDDFNPQAIQFSFDEAHEYIHDKNLQHMNPRIWQSFGKFFNMIKNINADRMKYCFSRTKGKKAENPLQSGADNFDISTLSAGECIAYSMGFYLRCAVAHTANKNDIPLLSKVFREDGSFIYATLKQKNEIEKDGKFGSCVSYTDLITTPITLLNRIQMEHFLDNKEMYYSEESLENTANWLNMIAGNRFTREKPWSRADLHPALAKHDI